MDILVTIAAFMVFSLVLFAISGFVVTCP